ncbi:hypothetical protein BME96_00300 [Virgibacillus halodenitrificans]|uniref:Uncharacterized protein n=1 Tax=Virgibacillus halodenitrificans TaxID=1482 RepID=A0AAC9IWH6_VIRHA|nr:hypothetical protein BME96_00300 [Virgibacillus halodenitrificans]
MRSPKCFRWDEFTKSQDVASLAFQPLYALRGLIEASPPTGQGKLRQQGIARRKCVFSFSRSLHISPSLLFTIISRNKNCVHLHPECALYKLIGAEGGRLLPE